MASRNDPSHKLLLWFVPPGLLKWCSDALESFSCGRRRRRRELRQVRKTEFALCFADLLLSIFKSIFAKHLVFGVFELIGDFVVDQSSGLRDASKFSV